jgi:hypothetical protein
MLLAQDGGGGKEEGDDCDWRVGKDTTYNMMTNDDDICS